MDGETGCGRRGEPRRRQFAALDPLPDDVGTAGAGDELPLVSLELDEELSFDDDDDEPSFDDDEPDVAVSAAAADVRLSVR